MKYMGSKRRIAKYILPIILKGRTQNQYYVEPFVGGANIIDKVCGKRVGADVNLYLIEALKLIRDNPESLPKNNSETNEFLYRMMKDSENLALKGYFGFALSYGGKWFGGWCRDGKGLRDYVAEAYRNAQKQSGDLRGANFICATYNELFIPPNSIIYCDPPYKGTTSYSGKFDHNSYWDWCREMTVLGNHIFCSEYSAPDDFTCLWQREVTSSLTQDTGSKVGVERLFTYNG